MNTSKRENQIERKNTVEYPQSAKRANTIIGLIAFALFLFSVVNNGSFGVYLITLSTIAIAAFWLFPLVYGYLEFDSGHITSHRFPMKPKNISWAEIELDSSRNVKYGRHLILITRNAKTRLFLDPAQIGFDKFCILLRQKRADLFEVPESYTSKRNLGIKNISSLIIWFLIVILYANLLGFTRGWIYLTLCFFFVAILMFSGTREIQLNDHSITIKTAFSEVTHQASEIDWIGFPKTRNEIFLKI